MDKSLIVVVPTCIHKSKLIKISPVKILSSIILSLFLLGFWSCSDAGKDPLSSVDETYCTQALDCNSVCGGSAVEDACGNCDGDSSTCTGCADKNANNYDNTATIPCSDDNEDGTPDCCAYEDDIAGCTDGGACNFNIAATLDDGSCTFPETNYDCNNNCIAGLDTCGTCGGSGLNADGCCGETSNCVHYKDEIQPIFNENCANCHISSTSNNLSLTNYASLMLGNSTNGPVIDAEDHANSLLWQYVNSGTMPPGNNNLTASQIDLIATWIDEGAKDN